MTQLNSSNHIYGKSPAIQESLRTASLLAATDVTTLITGETGTGKELFAQYIHQQSSRSDKRYTAINCAALPENLVESSLFGHKKGAFTDAVNHHGGYIAESQGGTLFLDEVAELPLNIQSKLLRFLENGECQPVGYSESRSYDVRIITATNQSLRDAVEAGNFREDLFYRLNIVPLELPSLRDRLGDIPLLVQQFFQDLVAEHKLNPPHISKAAQQVLNQYLWPGNVRELRNFCERMLILFAGKTIDVANLPIEICQAQNTTGNFSFNLPSKGIQLEELEKDLYQQAIQTSYGNKAAAARLLGISRDAFLYRLRKYGLR